MEISTKCDINSPTRARSTLSANPQLSKLCTPSANSLSVSTVTTSQSHAETATPSPMLELEPIAAVPPHGRSPRFKNDMRLSCPLPSRGSVATSLFGPIATPNESSTKSMDVCDYPFTNSTSTNNNTNNNNTHACIGIDKGSASADQSINTSSVTCDDSGVQSVSPHSNEGGATPSPSANIITSTLTAPQDLENDPQGLASSMQMQLDTKLTRVHQSKSRGDITQFQHTNHANTTTIANTPFEPTVENQLESSKSQISHNEHIDGDGYGYGDDVDDDEEEHMEVDQNKEGLRNDDNYATTNNKSINQEHHHLDEEIEDEHDLDHNHDDDDDYKEAPARKRGKAAKRGRTRQRRSGHSYDGDYTESNHSPSTSASIGGQLVCQICEGFTRRSVAKGAICCHICYTGLWRDSMRIAPLLLQAHPELAEPDCASVFARDPRFWLDCFETELSRVGRPCNANNDCTKMGYHHTKPKDYRCTRCRTRATIQLMSDVASRLLLKAIVCEQQQTIGQRAHLHRVTSVATEQTTHAQMLLNFRNKNKSNTLPYAGPDSSELPTTRRLRQRESKMKSVNSGSDHNANVNQITTDSIFATAVPQSNSPAKLEDDMPAARMLAGFAAAARKRYSLSGSSQSDLSTDTDRDEEEEERSMSLETTTVQSSSVTLQPNPLDTSITHQFAQYKIGPNKTPVTVAKSGHSLSSSSKRAKKQSASKAITQSTTTSNRHAETTHTPIPTSTSTTVLASSFPPSQTPSINNSNTNNSSINNNGGNVGMSFNMPFVSQSFDEMLAGPYGQLAKLMFAAGMAAANASGSSVPLPGMPSVSSPFGPPSSTVNTAVNSASTANGTTVSPSAVVQSPVFTAIAIRAPSPVASIVQTPASIPALAPINVLTTTANTTTPAPATATTTTSVAPILSMPASSLAPTLSTVPAENKVQVESTVETTKPMLTNASQMLSSSSSPINTLSSPIVGSSPRPSSLVNSSPQVPTVSLNSPNSISKEAREKREAACSLANLTQLAVTAAKYSDFATFSAYTSKRGSSVHLVRAPADTTNDTPASAEEHEHHMQQVNAVASAQSKLKSQQSSPASTPPSQAEVGEVMLSHPPLPTAFAMNSINPGTMSTSNQMTSNMPHPMHMHHMNARWQEMMLAGSYGQPIHVFPGGFSFTGGPTVHPLMNPAYSLTPTAMPRFPLPRQ